MVLINDFQNSQDEIVENQNPELEDEIFGNIMIDEAVEDQNNE